ncbi:putative fungal specific transcription factor [Lyophyllum shimeji]|uniref:Fungal specific transcription factor n=1 Tax=Lyophyllum shimeji TaxID=47721 RepID=A0A9P3PQP7_LYOSH|nr:putative fungal specific transcription factor [Lyophyllum shimeji]
MGPLVLADSMSYFPEPRATQVKTEASSPDLLPPSLASFQQYQFKFRAPLPSPSHASLPSSRHPSEPPAPTQNHIYRFGSGSAYNTVSNQSSWPSSPNSSHQQASGSSRVIDGNSKYGLGSSQHPMSYPEDYDDVSELVELPEDSPPNLGGADATGTSANGTAKNIRRRSSKACDQCRKSKCKCERPSLGEPCKSCVMLGTACTFLGPSRKRGPPKGYIDAIEARLHQTEALLGIMLSASDPRAQSLLRDLGKDPLAKEIINRVDNSPYGVKGRKRDSNQTTKPRAGHQASSSESSLSTSQKPASHKVDITSTHPSNEWQDRVTAMLHVSATASTGEAEAPEPSAPADTQRLRIRTSAPTLGSASSSSSRPLLRVDPSGSTISLGGAQDDSQSPGRRTRRRVGTEDVTLEYPTAHSPVPPDSAVSHRHDSPFGRHGRDHLGPYAAVSQARRWSVSSTDSLSSASDEELTGAVGQLSLNEDEQVRYHGKASGLHLLGDKERVDTRNEGGIWRFPKARVWPPLPSSVSTNMDGEDEYARRLPSQSVQEHLLGLYFEHVHPILPVVHKRAFLEAFKAGGEPPASPDSSTAPGTSPFNRRRRRVPILLLLAMYATAARYADCTAKPTDGRTMWEAGDEYLNEAKGLLDSSYTASRPSTCQALLLMGYREIGIGAMAQAWTYIGMAIRMAQDLGMHRSADGWARAELGGRLFGEWELHERKRIWYTCVIMDKYVSAYIGRPLMIFERDFDTPLPSEDDPEELEEWTPSSHPKNSEMPPPVPGRIISCFNASARLSGILSMIIQAIYAVRPVSSRHSESKFLEAMLDKWYLELSEHLRYELGSTKRPTPTPHVLTLHMQYWCAVLLLHRPFIRNELYHSRSKHPEESDDLEMRALAEKSYELCVGAANHITSIAMLYSEVYTLDRCANFLCYYIFTASIMHITSLTAHPSDPQARMGLNRCMDILHQMEILWPSAARALELLRGSKVNTQESDLTLLSTAVRRKRSAEHPLDDHGAFGKNVTSNTSVNHDYLELRAPYTSQNNYAAYTSTGHEIHPQAVQSPPQVSYLSSYDRWPSENTNTQSFGFPGTLSTSVLPQLYSTGIVDDRSTSASHRVHPPHQDQTRANHTANRYPQYWNDFSTFPQLGAAYGGYHEPAHIAQQPQSSSQMYLAEPYSLYNHQHSNQ